MTNMHRHCGALALALLAVLILPAGPALADTEAGIAAFLAGDRITAWRELLPAAKRGDAEAQFHVGTMYKHGFGTERDADEARFWYERAAAQGHAQAQFVLGFDRYQAGEREAAADYLVAAAQAGIAAAQYYVGLLYRDGTGVAQDAGEALRWLLRAAEREVPAAQYEAGLLLAYGAGTVEPDLKRAYTWFTIAAHGNYPGAAQSRDRLATYMTPAEIAAAVEAAEDWLARGAQ